MIKAAVIGASGYTGAELIRLISGHPQAEVSMATSRTYAGQKVSDLYPELFGIIDLKYTEYSRSNAAKADIVFVALPHGEAMTVVAELFGEGPRIIDISGDLRLADAVEYEKWYGQKHVKPELLNEAVYGLPELYAKQIAGAAVVSNPGCYPTSVLLALAPALKATMIKPDSIVISSLSGISGAGRQANETTHFSARSDSVTAYKAGGVHQHIPEMERYLSEAAASPVKVSFTPHLGPFSRGIYSTVYADIDKTVEDSEVRETFVTFYKTAPFVKIMPVGEMPEMKAVLGSNYCHLGVAVDTRTSRLTVCSAIDNLVKGAAGQAIQNMNIMLGLPEETGLQAIGLWP
ncbi:MAG: N-acetyl-gamma-glutamyl-phosphate reductase [Actinomycetota bacterium]